MNRHSSTYKPNDQLSLDDLKAYQADQLSGPARHRVERLMLENPFYADALDGLDALQQVGGSLKAQTRDLHIALQERVHESATPRRLMPLWVTSLVASVLLVLSVAVYLIFNTAQTQKQVVHTMAHQIEPGTVLIDPKDLGTSEAAVTVPAGESVVGADSHDKLSVRVKKPARKAYRPLTKRATAAVEVVDTIILSHSSSETDNEVFLLPHITSEVPNRQINTERAFLN